MEINVIQATQNPIAVISAAAGTSYGKSDTKDSRVRLCYHNGHMSVFEHASFTVRIDGISRACSHQLVRHRLASFVEQSQRYTRIDVTGQDWYVLPPCFDGAEYMFSLNMRRAAMDYLTALGNGMKPEDARYLLPQATKTSVTMTMNARELFVFLDLRLDKAAQWEIRELANALVDVLDGYDGGWWQLMDLYEEGTESFLTSD